ncbi:MAG: DUF4280 domain-containing protein [Peptococcaceae bacterium]|nr:DUF4280 domain-containing protein [Peptococcaceae bacterium]
MSQAQAGNVSLSSLSEKEQEAINDLINSQYAPESPGAGSSAGDADSVADSAGGDESAPVPWRERGGGQYPYLVRGAYLHCQHGSHMRRLNLPQSHGYYIGEDPLMNAMDNVPGEGFGNIPPFGVCQAPAGPKGVGTVLLKAEKNNPITGGPYTDANGNILKIDDNVKGPPCTAIYVGQWQNAHQETLIGAADETPYEAITVGSFLVCQYMGIVEPMTSGQPELDPPKADPEMATLPPEI